MSLHGRPFTSMRARREHAKKQIVRADGRRWLAPRLAARFMGVSLPTLAKWQISCPWLDGKGIESRNLPSGYGRIITYYAEIDLGLAKKTRLQMTAVPTIPGYVYILDVATELGISVVTLRCRMKAKKVMVKAVLGTGKDGRPFYRSFVPQSFVDQERVDQQKQTPADEITMRDAGDILGITVQAVHDLISKGILTGRAGKITCRGEYERKGIVLSRAQVESHLEAKREKYGPRAERRRIENAKSVLLEILADRKPHLQAEIVKRAQERGVGYQRLLEARKKLRLQSERPGGGPAYWRLPGGPGAERRRLETAKSVLLEILADGKSHLLTEVVKLAKERGVRHDLVWAARKKLKLQTEQPHGGPNGGPGYWRLPGARAAVPETGNGAADPQNISGPAQIDLKTKPGRPKGSRERSVVNRDAKMKTEWEESGKTVTGPELAERYGVQKTYAYALIRKWLNQ